MADKRFTDLDSQTTPLSNDIFPFVTSPGSTPTAKKLTFSNLEASLNLANQGGKDTDGALAANSDTKFPTQKAVKTYVDTRISGANSGDQLIFNTIAVSGQSSIVADSTADTLTFVPGTNISLITNASTDTITINASGGSAYTDEMAQDAIGTMLDPTLLYIDATPSLKRAPISGDVLILDGSNVAAITSGVIVNADVNASAAITYSKLNLFNSILNTDISSAAAIDPTKIGSGDVNALKFHYLSGTTSDVQIQLNNRIVSGAIDIDGVLIANSDIRIPSQKAVKTYVDNRLFTGSGSATIDASHLITGRLANARNTLGAVFYDNSNPSKRVADFTVRRLYGVDNNGSSDGGSFYWGQGYFGQNGPDGSEAMFLVETAANNEDSSINLRGVNAGDWPFRVNTQGKMQLANNDTPSAPLTFFFDEEARISQKPGGYHNFSNLAGSGGYGLRDVNGMIQFKHSGQVWANMDVSRSNNGPAINLAGGTGLSFGTNYYDVFSGNRTLGFTGTQSAGSTCSLKFMVSGAARTINFPSSQREGGNGIPITSLVFQTGDHEFSWVLDDNKYWLVDTASPELTSLTTSGSGISWTEITSTSQTAATDNYYIANNAALVTVTLPATAAVGKVIKVVGKGAGLWKIAQNANEFIHFGNSVTTVGTAGYLASINQYDSVELVCLTADTEWNVISNNLAGGLTVV